MNSPKKPARPGGAARRATVQKRYLTYKLDLIKTLATKAADAYYVEASGMRVRELRLLRLVHDTPGVAATELRHRLVLDKTLLSKNLADLEKRGLIERETDPHDNRVQRLHLSAVGLRVWRECERIGRRLEAEMFADMPRTTGTACTICSTARWPRSTAGAPSTEGVAPNPKSGRAP